MIIEQTKTIPGFDRGEFFDSINNFCSVQIETEQHDLWLGVEVDLQGLGSTRMCLTREQVKILLPILQRFAATGEIFKKNVKKGI